MRIKKASPFRSGTEEDVVEKRAQAILCAATREDWQLRFSDRIRGLGSIIVCEQDLQREDYDQLSINSGKVVVVLGKAMGRNRNWWSREKVG